VFRDFPKDVKRNLQTSCNYSVTAEICLSNVMRCC